MVSGLIGGSLPTSRGRKVEAGEKSSATFYFQVIHPEAMNAGLFAKGRNQQENLKAVLEDVLGYGNSDTCIFPGQIEANAAKVSTKAGGLLFSAAEIAGFNEIAAECGMEAWDISNLKTTVA